MTISLNFFKVNASQKELNSRLGLKKKRSHAVATAWVNKDGEYKATIVLDYYTPKYHVPGWYIAFRAPGHVERLHPVYRVYVSSSLCQLNQDEIYTAMNLIAQEHIDRVNLNDRVITTDWRNTSILNY